MNYDVVIPQEAGFVSTMDPEAPRDQHDLLMNDASGVA